MEQQIQQEQKLTKRERKLLKKQEQKSERDTIAKKEAQKKLILWSTIILIVVASIYGLNRLSSYKPANPIPLTDAVTSSDQTKGTDTGKVLIEYSDFQCPACKTYYPIIKRLNEELGDKFLFVYRNFPLSSIHKNAVAAASAAEAAGEQDGFWQMHNLLFENQSDWQGLSNPTEKFISYAEEIGINIEKFKNDISSAKIKNKVNADYASGIKANVPGTPTFFLNGEQITTPRNYEDFKNLIQ